LSLSGKKGEFPKHVAIIMDGNGRFAQKLGKSRLYGHKMGVRRLWEIIEATSEVGIPILSVFAFSTENWLRPSGEVKGLFRIARSIVRLYAKRIQDLGIRFFCIGDRGMLNPKDREAIERLESSTEKNQRLILAVALGYGGRWDILEASRKVAKLSANGNISPDEITEDRFRTFLPSGHLPDPDLLIRTGGEYRVSNFMLWQLAYSELYFSEELWPAFTKEHYFRALEEYVQRERRFGRLK
jgi:undecaprenyl diphosphate synthase